MPHEHDEAAEEALDRLLARAPAPEAPAWFEARLQARLLREKDASAPAWKRWAVLFRPWALAGCSAALLAVWAWHGDGVFTGKDQIVELPVKEEDAELTKALEAFASYMQDKPAYVSDSEEWLPF